MTQRDSDYSKDQPLRLTAFQITIPSHHHPPSPPSSSRPSTSLPHAPPSPFPSHSFKIQSFPPKSCLDQLVFMLIRPPKFTYLQRVLSTTPRFKHNVERIPFPLSIFTPYKPAEYYVLYLHGNSSSRIEGVSMLDRLPEGVGLACFDFEGCGNRTGEWVTLGLKESAEVDRAVEFMVGRGMKVVVWGRSMGAVSALMSTKAKVLVVDSAFSDLKTLCYETACHNTKYIPNCLISCFFPCIYSLINGSILKKTGENISKLNLTSYSLNKDRCIMFIAAEQDEIVQSHHSKQLYKKFEGVKECLWFEGTHNSIRGEDVLGRCFRFAERNLGVGGRAGFGGMAFSRVVEASEMKMTYCSELVDPTELTVL